MATVEQQVQSIAALLRAQSTFALATAGENGEPCVAPLFYVVDEELTLYWLSSESSLHSLNLERTPRAAATVYRTTENAREICGVQMRGAASLIADRARRDAIVQLYCERFDIGAIYRLAIRQSALYAFRPEWIRFIDNDKRFGYKFEITREGGPWRSTRQQA